MGYVKKHPYLPVYVSSDGKVFSEDGNEVVYKLNKITGYLTTNVPGYHTRNIHRLVAETLVPNPDPENKTHVNHVDGIKLNNSDGNLEWVTPSENSLHAYREGLRTDNRQLEIRDIRDNSVYSFYSLQELARFLGVNASKIHEWLTASKPIPFLGLWDIREKDGEWKNVTVADLQDRLFARNRNSVIVARFDNNPKAFIYGSPKEAIEREKLTKKTTH